LTTVIYMLALHPEVMQRLRHEIASVVPSGRPTYENIRQLQYRTSTSTWKPLNLTILRA
jgi:hypothetical protein